MSSARDSHVARLISKLNNIRDLYDELLLVGQSNELNLAFERYLSNFDVL